MKNKKTLVLERMRKRISPEQREFVRMNLNIAMQISTILKERGWSQKEFAKKLGKQESEVSRFLSGLHNFSLKSLAKMKVVLGEEIITTPLEACEKYKSFVFVPLKSYAKASQDQNRNYPEKENIEQSSQKQTYSLAS